MSDSFREGMSNVRSDPGGCCDPDQDVIEIQFRQAPYATRFRVMNREATSSQHTEETPWFRRSVVWKVIVIVLFIAFMARLMK
ncbi:MAG: hypothetical protein ACEQSE_03075 [Candidatus Aquirickettsiella gammari]